MRLAIHPPRIDQRRAARFLKDSAHILASALPFVLGLLARLVWRGVLILWIVVLWIVGAALAGWDYGGKR